jgi:branched-chain amino acid transport system substrate-binding protein
VRVPRAFFFKRSAPALLAATSAALLGLAAAGCNSSGGGGGSAAGGTGGGDGGAIRIGHYASMTGENSTFGVETDNGIKLAAEEINAAGGINGRQVRIETQDDQSKPEEAVTVVTKFASDPNIVAVLGEVASTRSKAAAPVLQSAQVPMVSPSSTNPEVTRIGDYIFRVCFIDPFQGYVMAKFARENLKVDRVAIMRDQKSDYSVGLADVFKDEFAKMGGTIVQDVSYNSGDSDFRAQLARVKAANPQAIYATGYYPEVGPIARQARELGVNVPLMGGDGWDSPQLIPGAGGPGKALENCYFSNHYSKDDKSPRVQDFVKAYRAKYNAAPSGLAAMGYDAMKLLGDAIQRAGSADRKAIRDALAATKNFPGVTGDITIDAERNATKPAVVLQIKGNEFVYAATVQPPTAVASSGAGSAPAAR